MTTKKQPAPTSASGPAPTELENLLKRLQADFDNYRKRMEQEKVHTIQSANAKLLLDILPVVDNFRRAITHRPVPRSPGGEVENSSEGGGQDNWSQGIQAIERQLEDILQKHGLQAIEVTVGDEFNPTLHEAIAHQPSGDHQPNSIIKIVENGYQLSGKVLRPAKVVVS